MDKPQYGNWVSKKIIYAPTIFAIIFSALAVFHWIFIVLSVLSILIFAYFVYVHYLFSSKGKNVQNKIWDSVVANLDWDGQGKALDVGCGNGALTIKLAKKYPQASLVGVDYWGKDWGFSRNTCETNAILENVNSQTTFQQASASKLPFNDEYFDAAVSNLVFHEVNDQKDKVALVKEALRVVKKGGKFAFQDLFLLKQLYGSPEELVKIIQSWGITKVEFIATRDEPFISPALRLPFIVGTMGLIKGVK